MLFNYAGFVSLQAPNHSMLFFLVGWLYVLLAPYTKVEESFSLHATHDIIYHGVSPSALPNVRYVLMVPF